ncbi:protein translocase subunit SecF [Patescibacteria group bacterium]|nr:protein translocase subunit SecF [Patescibacteria group bacterium]MBU1563714.1 protein translocase subunit SecF [Patescibacteria group bacterium]
MMQIVKHRKIYFTLSGLLLLGSLVSLLFWGLSFGIDFTGGSLMEVEYLKERPSNQEIQEKLSVLDLGQITLQPTGDRGLILRLKDITENDHQNILKEIGLNQISEKRFESIGPLIGQELKRKAIWAIGLALIAIIFYIAWSFRKVSRPVASWQYGLVAVIALFHDIFITLGIFSILSHFREIEIGLPFVAAFLTILGYSVNNSIVIFDRARENLLRTNWDNFSQVINESVNQSLTRCLNTALTTLFVLLAIFFLGGETIKYFSLALIIGIVVGTYSSIFITSSLIVSWYGRKYNN